MTRIVGVEAFMLTADQVASDCQKKWVVTKDGPAGTLVGGEGVYAQCKQQEVDWTDEWEDLSEWGKGGPAGGAGRKYGCRDGFLIDLGRLCPCVQVCLLHDCERASREETEWGRNRDAGPCRGSARVPVQGLRHPPALH